jgi:hypothetical protein
MCGAAGLLLAWAGQIWPLVLWACKGHDATQQLLLGSGKLQGLFALAAEEVLGLVNTRGDPVPQSDMVRMPGAWCAACRLLGTQQLVVLVVWHHSLETW